MYISIASCVAFDAPDSLKIDLAVSIFSELSSNCNVNNFSNAEAFSSEENSNAFRYKYVFLFSIISPPTCFPKVSGSPKASR
ncbi:hypothetical protein D3C72_1866890 [compost metagenome]